MRAGRHPSQCRPVRFIVELDVGEDRRVAGTVLDQDGTSTAFAGWLELLRLLEGRADHTADLREETHRCNEPDTP